MFIFSSSNIFYKQFGDQVNSYPLIINISSKQYQYISNYFLYPLKSELQALQVFFFNLFCVLDTRNIGFHSFCPLVRIMRQIWHSCPRLTSTGCGMFTCWPQQSTPGTSRSLRSEGSSITSQQTSLEKRQHAKESRKTLCLPQV